MSQVQNMIELGNLVLGEDEIERELGIGPEEIVATAMLSLWISERGFAVELGRTAFKWARGWINVSLLMIWAEFRY